MCAFARLRAWQSLVEANVVSVVWTPRLIFRLMFLPMSKGVVLKYLLHLMLFHIIEIYLLLWTEVISSINALLVKSLEQDYLNVFVESLMFTMAALFD